MHSMASPQPTFELHTKILPTEYETCELVLLGELTRIQKEHGSVDGILSLGEGREEFKIETQANNMDHAPNTADNAGVVRNRQVIFTQLPEALPLSFGFDAFEIERSINPGFFVCNHLCARMSVRQHQDPQFPRFGFIHVPRLEFTPHWTTEQCAKIIYEGVARASQRQPAT
jgi:pyrrolidone-carboxylate peptidase